MKVYIVIGLPKNEPPVLVGVYKSKASAETAAATANRKMWYNIIEKQIEN